MRRVNRLSYLSGQYHNTPRHNKPCQCEYTFARPKGTVYLKVLNYIANHPFCKRSQIIEYIWPIRCYYTSYENRGYASNMFSNMLYKNLIDYNEKYEYIITSDGYDIIAKYSGGWAELGDYNKYWHKYIVYYSNYWKKSIP